MGSRGGKEEGAWDEGNGSRRAVGERRGPGESGSKIEGARGVVLGRAGVLTPIDGHIELPPLQEVDKDPRSMPPLIPMDKDKGEGRAKGKEEMAAMTPIAEGIQPLPAKLVQRIDSGEFIDFSDLLQDQLPQEDFSFPSGHAGVVLVQSLETLRKKHITDFQAWAEAFMVFVYTSRS